MPSSTSRHSHFFNAIELVGRLLIVILYLFSGAGKITSYAETASYMSSTGVPSALLPVVIALEILGSIAIVIGWRTRFVAFLMAGFTLLTALVFHTNFSDSTQQLMLLKNVSITGAFLLLVANGAGRFSIDSRRS